MNAFFCFVERSAQGGNNVRLSLLPFICGQHVLLLVCMFYYLDPVWLLTFLIPCKVFAEDVLRLLSTSVIPCETAHLD